MVVASLFGERLARGHVLPSPDIDQTHVRPNGLGLANNVLAPDLPHCAAARSVVFLSRSTVPGVGVAPRL